MKIFFCGVCSVCKRNHYSNENYWIITASRVNLCRIPCWDEYIANTSKYIGHKTLSDASVLTKPTVARGKYPNYYNGKIRG